MDAMKTMSFDADLNRLAVNSIAKIPTYNILTQQIMYVFLLLVLVCDRARMSVRRMNARTEFIKFQSTLVGGV